MRVIAETEGTRDQSIALILAIGSMLIVGIALTGITSAFGIAGCIFLAVTLSFLGYEAFQDTRHRLSISENILELSCERRGKANVVHVPISLISEFVMEEWKGDVGVFWTFEIVKIDSARIKIPSDLMGNPNDFYKMILAVNPEIKMVRTCTHE